MVVVEGVGLGCLRGDLLILKSWGVNYEISKELILFMWNLNGYSNDYILD